MFRNDETGPDGVVRRGLALARDLGHPRVGSEHLLLALIADCGPAAGVLARHWVTATAVRAAACAAAPGGAGAAADRSVLAAVGVDLDRVLGNRGLARGAAGALERPVGPVAGIPARRQRRPPPRSQAEAAPGLRRPGGLRGVAPPGAGPARAAAPARFAEDYHQQYLAPTKNPYGYCPDHGTGVSCPVGVVKADAAGLLPAEG